MQPESSKYLYDVRQAAERLNRFTEGKTFADYSADDLLRSAVERQCEIIGEAINQLSRINPETASQIEGYRRIIAFRNILIHGYAQVDDAIVWGLVQTNLPGLLNKTRELLGNDESLESG